MSSLPFDLPKGFETLQEAKRHSIAVKRLISRYGGCIPLTCRPRKPCGKDGCPVCSRRFRINLFKSFYELGLHEESLVAFNGITEHNEILEGRLEDEFDLVGHVKMITKRLERSSLKNQRVIAGLDLSFNKFENQDLGWKPHWYGIVVSKDRDLVREGLKEVFPKSSQAKRPVRTRVVKEGDWPRVLSYAYKNGSGGFYSRSGYLKEDPVTGRVFKDTWPNRLTNSQKAELLMFLLQYAVGDRLLLRGLRRDPVTLLKQPSLRLTVSS